MERHSLDIAFILGLFSAIHCVWMCGSIATALSMSLQKEIKKKSLRLLPYILAFNAGRIGTYIICGWISGMFGEILLKHINHEMLHPFVKCVVSLILLGLGLYMLGWFPRLSTIESAGKPLWRLLEPISQRLIPISNPIHALSFGAIWGFMPCGPSYSMLFLASTTSSGINGAMLMLAYGLGTLPALIGAGLFGGWIVKLTRMRYINTIAGILLCIISIFNIMDML
ncbi:MAG: sulfite exporter TauE/SafE family protein [Nitrospirae bacterium]|nr:MAG: sulfite exporter TauE/SafE family protein [Nitrospirota bacterium]